MKGGEKRMRKEKKERKTFKQFAVSPKIHQRVRIHAAQTGESLTTFVERAVVRELDNSARKSQQNEAVVSMKAKPKAVGCGFFKQEG